MRAVEAAWRRLATVGRKWHRNGSGSGLDLEAANGARAVLAEPAANAVRVVGMVARQLHGLVSRLVLALANVALLAAHEPPAKR